MVAAALAVFIEKSLTNIQLCDWVKGGCFYVEARTQHGKHVVGVKKVLIPSFADVKGSRSQ